jgi:uncharacterized membrane protein YeaQ/YmgE (transglycosylase-associated protein family)
MGLLSWVIFGALAGWVASLIAGTNQRQGCLMDIVVGVIGALLGGFLVNLLGGDVSIAWNPISFVVAVGGALLLLFVTGAARRRRRR